MEQYLTIKSRYEDAILFFRMGDFYEMFYEDAKVASQVLGIALTSRAHGKASEVPLAGFPHHALDVYLTKMIKAGYRVAICEQIEDPKLAKTIVKREVLEVISPGTALSEDLLESKRNNYLVSIFLAEKFCGLAIADISTGEFLAAEFREEKLREQVRSFNPAEVLVSVEQQPYLLRLIPELKNVPITTREGWIFSYDYSYEKLTEHFNTLSLKGFGCDDFNPGISAAGGLLHYLKESKRSDLNYINRLARFDDADFLMLDETTRRNLELIQPIMASGNRRATLMSILDQTKTAMGGRLLVNWLLRPLTRAKFIQERLDAVDELFTQTEIRSNIRKILEKVSDLERLLARISTGRANARDLINLKTTLEGIPPIKQALDAMESTLLMEIRTNLQEKSEIIAKINDAIVDSPPLSLTEGGLIKKGYHAELDELRLISVSGKDWIARLQKSEREKTGISSLKVNYNKVFGYYIEITNPHLAKVPPNYIRKQTLVNAERYITPELKEYEEKVLGAEEKIIALEYELFDEIRQFVAQSTLVLQENARNFASLDCLSNLAEIARQNDYSRPTIDEGEEIIIQQGRHPVIEKLLPHGESFVSNDVKINNSKEQILIITGPNMAGKSTYLRQIGLLVLMTQMGSFIPARSAKIGLVDKIFTRVGASDNLAAGESTFLTEMNETANILNNATPKSLILLDEIGRGTSTFDGLSIAWSVAEFLHNNEKVAAKTLFATHYHELTELERILNRVKNYNVAIKEWGDHIVFLRKIVEGGCDNSYGIHVAQLAGLPSKVISRAKEILSNLEANELTPNAMPRLAISSSHTAKQSKTPQLDLFEREEKKLREELMQINPNEMTPKQALEKLFDLINLFKN
jgi:DNA mismatch repair protein MutS